MAADEGAKAHSAASAHDRLVFKPKEQTVDGITVLIDNYDSFTFNIVQYLCQLGTEVFRNDKVTLEELEELKPARVVLSPGPGHPSTDAGVCAAVLDAWQGRVPILGVCMGLQVMYEAYGGTVASAGEIMHGKASSMQHDGKGLFAGLPSPYTIVRYHSLAGSPSTLPADLEVAATTAGGIIQAVRHRKFNVHGVQFHPESILTQHGMELLGTFCAMQGGMAEAAAD